MDVWLAWRYAGDVGDEDREDLEKENPEDFEKFQRHISTDKS